MTPLVGFCILSHNNPAQLSRLCRRLATMFPDAPIVCHHDFSQSRLDETELPPNVTLVRPHLRTAWADFSVVEATVRAFRAMDARPDSPDWSFLLSGADYPIKPANEILRLLRASSHDAYIEHELIRPGSLTRDWHHKCAYRYHTLRVHLPVPSPGGVRWKKLEARGSWARRLLPFSRRLDCYAGSQWFTVNRRARRHIVSEHRRRPRLAAHYRSGPFSEESYFQTLLANARHLRLHESNLRFIRFTPDADHPDVLTLADLPSLLASDAVFARKFDVERDAGVLDALDGVIDAAVPQTASKD